MTTRIMGIELRRSAALLIGLLVCTASVALSDDPEIWAGRWMLMVIGHRDGLFLLWPLVAAGGAWLAQRDRTAGIDELLGATPRPRSSRVAPIAAVLGIGAAGGYALSLAEPLFWTVRSASYQPPGWGWLIAIGALSLVAAALVGLALGRLMPSRLTAPVLLLLGVVVVILLDVLGEWAGSRVQLLLPQATGWAEFSTLHWRTNVGQALWFTALAVGGFALFAATGRRAKRLAVLPVALGLAVGVAVLPPVGQAVVADPAATALVCAPGEPRVCVTKVYEPVLPQLVAPARRALLTLRRLPNAPTAVVQETQVPGFPVRQHRENVHFDLTVFRDGKLAGGPDWVESAILDGAGTWSCGGSDDAARDRIQAARAVAGAWLQGRSEPPADYWATRDLTAQAWTALRALPAEQQLARIAALREAALQCRDDLYTILTAPAG